MVPNHEAELSLDGGQYVPLHQVDRLVLSGTKRARTVVVLKNGERLRARRSSRALAQDLSHLRERHRLEQHAKEVLGDPDAPDVLSTREAAEITGYSVAKVQRLIRKGKIQASKVEGRWAIDRWSLYLWFAERG